MKRFKWAALVAAMVSMVGFTSCLNNDDDGTRTTLGYFRAVGNYGAVYFQDMYDFKYQPTTSLMDSPTSELAFCTLPITRTTLRKELRASTLRCCRIRLI